MIGKNIFFSICGMVLIAGAAWWYVTEVAPFKGRPFNEKEWREPYKDGDYSCIRGSMYKDLKRNYLRTGTTVTAVKELLGEADFPSAGRKGNCLSYYLGVCSGGLPDADLLLVCFDKNDQIIDVQHIFHSA